MERADLLLGTVIDNRYRLSEFIGSGSYGSVFAADEVTLGRVIGRPPIALRPLRIGRPLLAPRTLLARTTSSEYKRSRLTHCALFECRTALSRLMPNPETVNPVLGPFLIARLSAGRH